MSEFIFDDGTNMVVPDRFTDDEGDYFLCPVCDEEWTEEDIHHPEYDPTPKERHEVTEGWTPANMDWRKKDEYNPEGI